MPQGSPSKRDPQPEHPREDSESSSRDQRPGTALGEVLHEVEEAGTRVGDDDERRRKDGESGDAMTPNEKEQEHSEPDGA
ncbi:hypothetical protein ABZ252_27185 [Streptomyces sp. NPDC006175]|uniref:hypothetical protein n=1 Tax=unclassified Streptomyces TaxID=2593676 RepID=UPI0033BF2DF5